MRLLLSLVLLAAGAVAACVPRQSIPAGTPVTLASTIDSAALRNSLTEAADALVKGWRYYWEVSDRYRALSGYEPTVLASPTVVPPRAADQTWPPPSGIEPVVLTPEDSLAVAVRWKDAVAESSISRSTVLHCHPDLRPNNRAFMRVEAYIIESSARRRAICPSWYPIGAQPPWDERNGIDVTLIGTLIARIRQSRRELLAQLDRGATLLPGDGWITGQRVRFALDQLDTTAALRASAECKAEAWWCSALDGFLLHAGGRTSAADSTFAVMITQMPADVGCEWTDLSVLLSHTDREEYNKVPCANRDSVNTNLWWLADPLYSDAFNERRAEHYARRVFLALRSGTTFHERWDLRHDDGGDAVSEMLLRYGWPNYSYWGGLFDDRGHYGYLGIGDTTTWDHGRFTTAEYTYPRFRLVPSFSAIQNPTRSRDHDWAMTATAHKEVFPADTLWWPLEHYERAEGPFVQLWNQHGMFRRDENILLAISSNFVADDFGGASRDTLWGWLFTGRGPSSMRRELKGAVVGLSNVFKSFVEPVPQLVALQIHGSQPAGVVARTRFGIEPPPPLSAMAPGEIAISAPVFIRPTTPDQLPPSDPEAALSRMYGGAIFRDAAGFGLYWETYGITERDSVDLTIRVESQAPRPGLLRRIGFALGLGERPLGAVTVEWSEPQPQAYMKIASGSVPIQGRILRLALPRLRPGHYTMVVRAARIGSTVAVTGSREFWIVE